MAHDNRTNEQLTCWKWLKNIFLRDKQAFVNCLFMNMIDVDVDNETTHYANGVSENVT